MKAVKRKMLVTDCQKARCAESVFSVSARSPKDSSALPFLPVCFVKFYSFAEIVSELFRPFLERPEAPRSDFMVETYRNTF